MFVNPGWREGDDGHLMMSIFYFIFKNVFIYLFLTVLGLCCCAWIFSSCSDWGLLSSCVVGASYYGGFTCCRVQALGHLSSIGVVL